MARNSKPPHRQMLKSGTCLSCQEFADRLNKDNLCEKCRKWGLVDEDDQRGDTDFDEKAQNQRINKKHRDEKHKTVDGD